MSEDQSGAPFPSWILETARTHTDRLNPTSLAFLEQGAELYPHFDMVFVNAPPVAELTVLCSYDLDRISANYPEADPRLLILRSAYEQFFFITGYQIRELAIPLAESFKSGEFYVSAILVRSILEISGLKSARLHPASSPRNLPVTSIKCRRNSLRSSTRLTLTFKGPTPLRAFHGQSTYNASVSS